MYSALHPWRASLRAVALTSVAPYAEYVAVRFDQLSPNLAMSPTLRAIINVNAEHPEPSVNVF